MNAASWNTIPGFMSLAVWCSSVLVTRAQTWTLTSAPSTNWSAVASSADGAKLIAAVYGGGIYISTNSGTTWAPTPSPVTNWTLAACSGDGAVLLAAVQGRVFLSGNGGGAWADIGAPEYTWLTLASSADGRTLLAGSGEFMTGGVVLLSTNRGATWAVADVVMLYWYAACLSADGSRIIVLGNTGLGHLGTGAVANSEDGGASWASSNGYQWPLWISGATSADGRTLVGGAPYGVFISRDYGTNWQESALPSHYWHAITCSADGTRIAGIADESGAIYASADSGVTWIEYSPTNLAWSSIASSADGHKLVAAVNGRGIYTLQTTPTPVLDILPSGTNVFLSWTIPSQPFLLQQSSDLKNWSAVGTTPVLNYTNLHYEVNVLGPTSSTFFRLASQ
ncbi:MAG TPA: sialidase family protein [Candidatus Acidoferrum sp.]|nr:sialidase family protein [Candidatus Acidoferrum sp.]